MQDKNAQEIVEALKTCAIYENCHECQYKDECIDDYPFSPRLLSDALLLIERNQYEIEEAYLRGYCRGRGRAKRWKCFADAKTPFENMMCFKCPSCHLEWTTIYPKDSYPKPHYCPWCGAKNSLVPNP